MLKLSCLSLALLMVSVSALAEGPVVVSQKGKVFTPGEITIPVGATVRIMNDDRVLHHVYIESPEFNFDETRRILEATIGITVIETIRETRIALEMAMAISE